MDPEQKTGGTVISNVNADPVYATEVFESIGVHPAEISHDLSQVRQASNVVEFFKQFENGLSMLRSVSKGVPVNQRIGHLNEYVLLKQEEVDLRGQMRGGTIGEAKVSRAELRGRLKDVTKELKFYEK